MKEAQSSPLQTIIKNDENFKKAYILELEGRRIIYSRAV